MNTQFPVKSTLVFIFKLLLCGILFFVGFMVGSLIATGLGLATVVPAGVDTTVALLGLLWTAPVMAFGIALVARGIGGGLATRALILSLFTWIVYGLNNALELLIVMPAESFWFTNVYSLVASLFAGTAAAFLFPAPDNNRGLAEAWRAYWATRTAGAWLARLALAAVVFMPIYYFFGLFAIQVTGPYFQQNIGGLTAPTLEQLLPILFMRSVLFMLVCLPVIVLWQNSQRALLLSLGTALFILIGFASLLAASWLPAIVRMTHSLEILADEFVYVWVLVRLLRPTTAVDRAASARLQPSVMGSR